MKILARLGAWLYRTNARNPAQWLIDWFHGGATTDAGMSITEDSALEHTPFWAAVRLISGSVSSLPLKTYKRVNEGKEENSNHAASLLLHGRPNEYMDAMTFIETRQAHSLVYGNGFAEIQRDGAGRPIALWPLLPNKTQRLMSEGGIPYYEVSSDKFNTVQLPDYNVLHIKGLGFDGYTGYNLVSYHKNTIALGKSLKKYASKFFGNGARPGGILEHPGLLDDEAAKRLRDSWNDIHSGLDNAHRVAILEEGMQWKQAGISPEDAQCLESQKFSVTDVARMFNVPPHMLADLDRATFSNIEEQQLSYYTTTLLYWLKKWEGECNYKLFTPSERTRLFVEFKMEGMLRGDMKSRTTYYSTGRQWGYLSVNDIRALENMNSIGDEGDIYLEPVNMKKAGEDPPEPPAPAPPVKDEDDEEDERARKIIAANHTMLSTLCGRVIRKEQGALSKAKTQAAIRAFYNTHRDHVCMVLSPCVETLAASLDARGFDVTKYMANFVTTHISPGKDASKHDPDVWANEIITDCIKYGDNHAGN